MRASPLLCWMLFATTTAVATPPSSEGKSSPDFVQLMRAERSLNVGKILPAGIMVMDKGKQVDLRSVLRGPVTLIKIESQCPPCDDLLQYATVHAEQYMQTQKIPLAVVLVGTADAPNASQSTRPFAFYTAASKLEGGILAGSVVPTVFFFDADLRLIGRHVGLTTPETSLAYPLRSSPEK